MEENNWKKGEENKEGKRKEKRRKRQEIWLAHNLIIISVRSCYFICAFNIIIKLYTAYTMVEQVSTKEETSSGTHGVAQGNKTFKKKNSKSKNEKQDGVPELLKGVCLTVAKDRPDLYLKELERLGVYLCATYKNGADLEMCFEPEELILPKEPVLLENPMAHQQKIWDLCMTAMIKNEDTLRQNI